MQLRKKIKTKKPLASAKPSGEVTLNHPANRFNWKDYKWKQLFSQLQLAI